MADITSLHIPKWQSDGADWHLIVGNRTVASLIPNSDPNFPHYNWLSIIDSDIPAYGWHAVDFETLEIAKYDLEHWYAYACRGEAYDPASDPLEN